MNAPAPDVKTIPPRGLLCSLTAWLARLGGAMTGDTPHRFAAEYPWPYGCWCHRPEEHEVHRSARQVLGAQREARR